MKLMFSYTETKSFDIKKNGIQLIEHSDRVEIYNDPFRTVPLFITRDDSGQLIIFSDFEYFYTLDDVNKDVDLTGFWEIVLFGGGLWTRTLYKNVQQMPGASKIVVNKADGCYVIERYWGFDVYADKSIKTMRQAVDGLYERLNTVFSKLDKNKKYMMGMSGGLDSRITLAFLSKHIPKENLSLFTYGFNENVLEYRYAKDVSTILGFNVPEFHKLTKESYRNAKEYLPNMTGGQIGINHCHFIDYLKGKNWKGVAQISNYYSDALFGWDCTSPKHIEDFRDNSYIKLIRNANYLPANIKNEVIADSLKIFAHLDENSNFSSLNEYKYVTERNQKFHMYLASIQGKFVSNELIYADIELLQYLLSIPIQFREQKKLLDNLLNDCFEGIDFEALNNVSSRDFKNTSLRFQLKNKISGLIGWYWFKFLNRANAILRIMTKGTLQLLNKYQTEEQERLLYSEFSSDLRSATSRFFELDLMTREQKAYWDKLPYGSAGVGERFALISLFKVLG